MARQLRLQGWVVLGCGMADDEEPTRQQIILQVALIRFSISQDVEAIRDHLGCLCRGQRQDATMMHFGKDQLCYGIDRFGWADDHIEAGDLYCGPEHCIMIPYVCGNVTLLLGRQPRFAWQVPYSNFQPQPYYPYEDHVEAFRSVPEPGTGWLVMLGCRDPLAEEEPCLI